MFTFGFTLYYYANFDPPVIYFIYKCITHFLACLNMLM